METDKKHPMVQFKGILKRFGSVVAVEKMDFDIEEGTLVTLLGPSGCGKTTLLRMVAGTHCFLTKPSMKMWPSA